MAQNLSGHDEALAQFQRGLADTLRRGLAGQADVEPYGDGTVTITGPVDLDELADHLITFGGIEAQS